MSEQVLNLNNDWEKVREEFKNHFRDQNIELNQDSCIYSSSGEKLSVHKDGKVSGSMPLHDNKFSKAREIIFREGEIELKADNISYIFRR
jgi:hypothetical protein